MNTKTVSLFRITISHLCICAVNAEVNVVGWWMSPTFDHTLRSTSCKTSIVCLHITNRGNRSVLMLLKTGVVAELKFVFMAEILAVQASQETFATLSWERNGSLSLPERCRTRRTIALFFQLSRLMRIVCTLALYADKRQKPRAQVFSWRIFYIRLRFCLSLILYAESIQKNFFMDCN